ncbi:hypothetical protein AtEden1_Chr4g0278141 [Arabidopsis thaliana]
MNFYKDGKKVISGKYHEGLYYLEGTVVKAEKSVPHAENGGKSVVKAVVGVRKKKSRKESSVQGGDESSTEESDCLEEVKSEKSEGPSHNQPLLRDHNKEWMFCDSKIKDERITLPESIIKKGDSLKLK